MKDVELWSAVLVAQLLAPVAKDGCGRRLTMQCRRLMIFSCCPCGQWT